LFDITTYALILVGTVLLVSDHGLQAIGYAYLGGYALYLIALYLNARAMIGFGYSPGARAILMVTLGTTLAVALAAFSDQLVAKVGAAIIILGYLAFAMVRLRDMGVFASLMDRLRKPSGVGKA
jgi:hypothetical protein